MRASATSRLAPPTGLHAARADTNAPKSDEASPFALLVSAAVPPAQKTPNTSKDNSETKQDDGKAAADQASATQAPQTQPAASGNNSQQASQPGNGDDQDQANQIAADQNSAPNPDAQQADLNTAPLPPVTDDSKSQTVSDTGDDIVSDGDNVALWPQSAQPPSQTGQAGKPIKADKKDAKDQPAQPDVAATATTDLLRPDLQTVAVAPVPTPQAPAPVIADNSGQVEIAAAPAIAPAAQPAAPQPADQTAPQAASQAAPPPANQNVPLPAAKSAQPTSQTAAQTASTPLADVAASGNPVPGDDDSNQPQIGNLSNDAPAAGKSQPKPVAAKTDAVAKTAKPATGKPQQVSDPAAVKSADAATAASSDDADDSIKADTIKNAATATDAAAPRLALNIANTIAVSATGQSAPPQTQAPDFTQHIQVTAQPHDSAANLPALAVEIAAKSQSGAKQFDIRLDPPELGRVEVRLSIDATGKASAHLSADQPQTLTLLQRDASVLTRALRDAGLDVSQDGLNFSLRQQSGQDSGAGANPGRKSGRGLSLTATTSIEATAASAAYSGPADGRLDIRV